MELCGVHLRNKKVRNEEWQSQWYLLSNKLNNVSLYILFTQTEENIR